MSSTRVEPTRLAETLLSSVIDGSYPDSDDIAGAVLGGSTLPDVVITLQKARENLYEEVRGVSRQNSAEINTWISEARKLHKDIEASKASVDDILQLAKEEQELEQELEDAGTQSRFLSSEIRFNSSLGEILSKLQLIRLTLSQVEHLSDNGELCHAIEILGNAEVILEEVTGSGETIVISLMMEKAKGLKSALVNKAEDCWRDLVTISPQENEISIRRDATERSSHSGETVVDALRTLDLLKGKVDQLHHQVATLFIAPRLDLLHGPIPTFSVDENTLRIDGHANDHSAVQMFADLRQMVVFFNTNLPPSVIPMFSRIFIPNLITRLISSSLSSSVPSSLDDLPSFEALLDETRAFEDFLHQVSWAGETELRDWAERAPKVWLAKRRETCLDNVRRVLAHGTNNTKVVERTETQTMKIHSPIERGTSTKGHPNEDIWDEDSNWKPGKPTGATGASTKPLQMVVDDDEDASGWGLDEDLDIEDEEPLGEVAPDEPGGDPSNEDGLDNTDWGEWGEDDDQPESKPQTPTTSVATAPTARLTEPHPTGRPLSSHSKDVALREYYTITSIPDAVMGVILQVVDEANRLSKLTSSSITPAAPGLLSIPTLILAAYRALAPISYPTNISSSMYIYNDCVRMAEQLLQLEPSPGLALSSNDGKGNVNLIQSFGKRHYAKEINSQRTILCDFLDGTQGFSGCTNYPQSVDCETAISSVVTRIQEIHSHWSKVLSPSALCQSVGLLLDTVVTKLINDIEDMADIPEAESVKISEFCEEISGFESLFPEGAGGISTIGFYCKNWLKFMFLHQILQSTIADILYMFQEGHLEWFGTDELVDLVKALFADNDIRRRCIDEIRRGGA